MQSKQKEMKKPQISRAEAPVPSVVETSGRGEPYRLANNAQNSHDDNKTDR